MSTFAFRTEPMIGASLGILETTGFTPAMAALDVMEKSAPLAVIQAELNDFLGVCLKVKGDFDSIQTALAAGQSVAQQMGGKPVITTIARPDARAMTTIESRPEYNPLIQQDVVHTPSTTFSTTLTSSLTKPQSSAMSPTTAPAHSARQNSPSFALGFIETQGFTAVFEAVDSACKAANVEVVGKEKLGGGYVTIIIKGDVAAVSAAVEAGKAKVEGLGTLIAAHIIARPSSGVLSLLP